jgi:hypothetical protein
MRTSSSYNIVFAVILLFRTQKTSGPCPWMVGE